MKLITCFFLVSVCIFNSCSGKISEKRKENKSKEVEVSKPKSKIDYYPFNDYTLALMNHSNPSEMYYAYKVVLLNKDSMMLEEMILERNKYELVKWELTDWNKNGNLELKYYCYYPTSSAAHGYLKEEIYSVKHDGFNKDFEIILDERECTPITDSLKRQVKKEYFFENETKIKVTETHFTYPCENFEFKKEIKNKTQTNQLEYIMIWNEDSLKFCKLKN